LSTELDNAEYELGGFWRRLLALLIDAVAIAFILQLAAFAAFPLSHGRVQYLGGIVALTCDKLDKVPEGISVPDDFGPTSINDCRRGLFGLISGRTLLITRTSQVGAITTMRQIVRTLDSYGNPVDVLAVDFLFVPLLLALRFAFDLGRGSPGRRICRLRLATVSGAELPSAARLGYRYLVQFAPLLIATFCGLGIGAFPEGSRLWIRIAIMLPTLVLAVVAIIAICRRKQAYYDRFAGTCMLRLDNAGAFMPTAASPPPLPAAAMCGSAALDGEISALVAAQFRGAAPLPDQHALPAAEPLAGVTFDSEAIESDVASLVEAEFHDAALPDANAPRAMVLPPPLPPRTSQNYFVRHWRGELSLPVSYWVNGAVLGFAGGFAIGFLNAFIYRGSEGRPLLWLSSLVAIWLGLILLTAWQSVGVWRSANHYRQGGNAFWGTAAQVMMVIGVLQVGYRFVSTGAPQIAGMVEIVAGDRRLGPHQFRVVDKGTVLEFSGGITFGVAEEMESFLAAMENVRWVRLNSIGGRILEAQKMSDLVKARGLITVVSKDCLSACTIVFLGGKERWIGPNARLGFHQVAFLGMTATDRRMSIAREEQRLQRFGLSRDFAERANKAEPGSMWFPEKDELLREHVATRIVAPSPKPASSVPPSSPGVPEAKVQDPRTQSEQSGGESPAPAPKATVGSSDPLYAVTPSDMVNRLTAEKLKAAASVVHMK
jgi:RDD family